jgi:myo-inositol-1(or 4)-monophosphatase
MTAWETETIRDLMLDAGRLALDYFDDPGTEHKEDRSLVTAADHAIENYLTEKLVGNDGFSGEGPFLIGEETISGLTEDASRDALSGVAWVVDPIDGTAGYANHLPTWGISIGRMEGGRLTDGALFLPCTGELLITDGMQVLYEQGSRDSSRWNFAKLRPLPVTERGYSSMGMVSLPLEIARGGSFSGRNPMQANGSAVYSLAKLVLGEYLAYVARIRLWDIAGAIPILRRLGCLLIRADGEPLGEAVTSDDWVLDPGNPRVWKCRHVLFVAGDMETVEYMRRHYHPAR